MAKTLFSSFFNKEDWAVKEVYSYYSRLGHLMGILGCSTAEMKAFKESLSLTICKVKIDKCK